ncbi:MAG: hypothetical protein DWG78_02040 [Chloroflexi bacterium]|nr:hypothetical protein [Chloroflexota bacterium]
MPDSIRDQFLSELIRLNPNGIRLDRMPLALQQIPENGIGAAVDELETQGIIRREFVANDLIPGRTYQVVTLSDIQRYPIRQTMEVNGRSYPRMLAGDRAGGEDLNFYVEVMGDIEKRALAEIQETAQRLRRRYWITTAGLLSIFISVFALVLRASEPLDPSGLSATDLFWLKAAELGPLAAVLLLFVGATYLVSRLP